MPAFDIQVDRYDFSADLTALDVKEHFRRNPARPGVSLFEMGIDGRRFDLIHINPYKQYIRIFEIKVSRSDFTGDHKWHHYAKYCHTFSFVCPHGLIQKDEVGQGVGLLWIYKWKYKAQFALRGDLEWSYGQQWVKRPKRNEVKPGTLTRLAFLMLERMPYRKHDVF